jgi:hypothetical protein
MLIVQKKEEFAVTLSKRGEGVDEVEMEKAKRGYELFNTIREGYWGVRTGFGSKNVDVLCISEDIDKNLNQVLVEMVKDGVYAKRPFSRGTCNFDDSGRSRESGIPH